MKKLADDWITKGALDFEYKKYILLAYLKRVSSNFEQHKLYPALADLMNHYKNAAQFKDEADKLTKAFPKKLTAIDLKNFRIFFESKFEKDGQLNDLEEIVDFTLRKLQAHITLGRDILDEVEEQIIIEPIGVKALEENEGLLLLDPQYDPYCNIYKYRISFFEAAEERISGLQFIFLDRIKKSIGTTLEQLKIQALQNIRMVSNYSTFRVVSLQPYPYQETLLPVIKRRFSSFLKSSSN